MDVVGVFWWLDGEFLNETFWKPGGTSCGALLSPKCALAMDVLGVCGSLAMLVWRGSSAVATKVCIMLWTRLLDC